MELMAEHVILIAGATRQDCKAQVLQFFEQSPLVHYDQIKLNDETIVNGAESEFSVLLDQAVKKNKAVLDGLVKELGESGFERCDKFSAIVQGYQSKLLHIIAHFLDGFIGIDTAFYNLIDDSHWLLANTKKAIADSPERCWLFRLQCYSTTPRDAVLLHM